MSKPSLPFGEFVALIAVMFAMIAFSIDAMLPAFPEIAGDLGLSDINRAQLVITIFFLGTGIGQLFMGPLSDALGRKPVIMGGLLLYMAACFAASFAQSLEFLLLTRFIAGVGVSAPRTATIAMVRDLYQGRYMARVMSIAMVLFVLVPAIAPLVGQTIMLNFGWRSIFIAFMMFAAFAFVWLGLRQPETHLKEHRQPIRIQTIAQAFNEVVRSRVVMTYTLVMSLGLGALFAYLNTAQQVYVGIFGAGDKFPLYFGTIAILSGSAGLINASLVVRFGMRPIATLAYGVLFSVTAIFTVLILVTDVEPKLLFSLFLLWSLFAFFIPGLTFGNLNALAMEPMGHIAGTASAVMGAISTVLSVVISVPIGLAFNGTLLPMLIGMSFCSGAAFFLMKTDPKNA